MSVLILTPETYGYELAVLLTCSLGCSNIASHIHSRWFSQGKINVLFIHWLVKAGVIIWGMRVIPLSFLFHPSSWLQWFSVLPAIFLGRIAVSVEMAIKRSLLRKKTGSDFSNFSKNKPYFFHRHLLNQTTCLTYQKKHTKVYLHQVHRHHARRDLNLMQFRLVDVMFVAVTEEVIFRGFFWQISLWLSSPFVKIALLISSVILFGVSHIAMGRGQFLSKCILGAFCMLSVCVVQSILPAIVVHVVFNFYAYQEMMKTKNIPVAFQF